MNYRVSGSGRLTIAVLFSLVLHTLLLFLIRFAQPSWKNPASQTTPLNVVLEKKVAEVSKPSGIPEASQDTKGKARIGVQEENSFPPRTLTAITHAQVDQPRTKIPKAFISKKILATNKPAKTKVVESEPDLLVMENPYPVVPEISEIPENEEKPFAPTPSVDNPVATVAPPIEKLVSPEPIPGEKQEKIVIAEPAQEKSDIEIPGNTVENAVKVEEQKPVKVAEPGPVKTEEPKPVKIEEPKPDKTEEAKPAKAVEPGPARTKESIPVITEGLAESTSQPSGEGKSDVFRAKPPGYAMPSLAELSIAAVRNLPREENKKIQFGERRKSVGLKEQDFRYAMYVEGVRLKLERIGSFNYPSVAARNNQGGTLNIKISIRSDGSLEDFNIVRPSIYEALNAGAEKIVRMSAPFSPFPDNIRKDTDILGITINWTFSNSMQSLD